MGEERRVSGLGEWVRTYVSGRDTLCERERHIPVLGARRRRDAEESETGNTWFR